VWRSCAVSLDTFRAGLLTLQDFGGTGAILSLQQLYALIGEDMKAVDAVIRRRFCSDVALIRQVAEYIVAGGGKRLRPALLLMAAKTFGYQGDGTSRAGCGGGVYPYRNTPA